MFTNCILDDIIWYQMKCGGKVMNNTVKDIRDVVAKMTFKKCGTITCIYNVDSKCSQKECELHERGLRQEED